MVLGAGLTAPVLERCSMFDLASLIMGNPQASVTGPTGVPGNVPVNPLHYANQAGSQFALEQLQRLAPGQNLQPTSLSNDSPFSTGPAQATIGGGPNAGLVANTYAKMPKDIADQMMRDEMKLLGWGQAPQVTPQAPPAELSGFTNPQGQGQGLADLAAPQTQSYYPQQAGATPDALIQQLYQILRSLGVQL